MTPSDTATPPDAAPEPRPGGTLEQWMAALAADLGLEPQSYDLPALLDVARDVAHGVARPAAPLSLFLVGLAAQRAGGTADDVAAACARASDLAAHWGAPS